MPVQWHIQVVVVRWGVGQLVRRWEDEQLAKELETWFHCTPYVVHPIQASSTTTNSLNTHQYKQTTSSQYCTGATVLCSHLVWGRPLRLKLLLVQCTGQNPVRRNDHEHLRIAAIYSSLLFKVSETSEVTWTRQVLMWTVILVGTKGIVVSCNGHRSPHLRISVCKSSRNRLK